VQEEPGDTLDTELRKVLVVDDERELADLAELLLCSCGLKVTVAYSATEALRILESDREINAIFSDVMMPGMNGLQLASVVKGLYPQIKIVLTSGYTSPALLAEHGYDRPYFFTPKPYRIQTVIELLRSQYKLKS
jgi:CheY-like chemotaxis protein